MKKSSLAILVIFTIVAATGLVAEAFQGLSNPELQQLAYKSVSGADKPEYGPPGHRGYFKGRGTRGMDFADRLGLTDEQRDKMREIKVAFRNQTRKTRVSLMSLKDEKRTMIMSAKIDQKKLKELDDAIVKAKSEIMTARLKMRRDRLSLLTPEQLKKLAETFDKRSHRRGHHGFHRRGWYRW